MFLITQPGDDLPIVVVKTMKEVKEWGWQLFEKEFGYSPKVMAHESKFEYFIMSDDGGYDAISINVIPIKLGVAIVH